MALEEAYPVDILTLYPEETDAYLRDLEDVDTFKTPSELAAKIPEATIQITTQAVETVRSIETMRRKLSYFAAVFFELQRDHPEAVARLPENLQGIVRELGSRSSRASQDAAVSDKNTLDDGDNVNIVRSID